MPYSFEILPWFTVLIKKNKNVLIIFSFIKYNVFNFEIPLKLNIKANHITFRTPTIALVKNTKYQIRIGIFNKLWFI